MKDIKNPIDEIEQKLAKQVSNKVGDLDINNNNMVKDLQAHDKFNQIFNGMNNY